MDDGLDCCNGVIDGVIDNLNKFGRPVHPLDIKHAEILLNAEFLLPGKYKERYKKLKQISAHRCTAEQNIRKLELLKILRAKLGVK